MTRYHFPATLKLARLDTDQFFGSLQVAYNDGRTWFVMQDPDNPFGFLLEDGRRIIPPNAYETDFASVPRVLQGFLPSVGDGEGADYGPAAVIHDYLYFSGEIEEEPVPRREADAIFLRAMKVLGVVPWRRRIMYLAVRAGGWFVWRKHGHAQPA